VPRRIAWACLSAATWLAQPAEAKQAPMIDARYHCELAMPYRPDVSGLYCETTNESWACSSRRHQFSPVASLRVVRTTIPIAEKTTLSPMQILHAASSAEASSNSRRRAMGTIASGEIF
jgi:hypothetical protein